MLPMKGSWRRNVRITGKKSLHGSHDMVSQAYAAKRRSNAPDEVQETERLYYHSNEWPFEEHEKDTADEADGPAQLLLAREEVERLVRPDDESESREEEDLCVGQRSAMIVERDTAWWGRLDRTEGAGRGMWRHARIWVRWDRG